MEQKNLKKWEIAFGEHIILITNWWDWDMTGSADLYVDGQHLDQNNEMLPDAKKPMLKCEGFSESIQSIEAVSYTHLRAHEPPEHRVRRRRL